MGEVGMVTLHQREHFTRAERAAGFARQALAELSVPGIDSSSLDRKWREFLLNWSSTLSQLCKALEPGKTKRHSDSIKNSMKSDPVLQYLAQSRDSDEHVLGAAEPVPSELRIGRSFVSIKGDAASNIVFKGNFTRNTRGELERIPDVVGLFEKGVFSGQMDRADAISTTKPKLILRAARNRSGLYNVPMAEIPEEGRALAVARYGANFLEANLKHARKVLDQD